MTSAVEVKKSLADSYCMRSPSVSTFGTIMLIWVTLSVVVRIFLMRGAVTLMSQLFPRALRRSLAVTPGASVLSSGKPMRRSASMGRMSKYSPGDFSSTTRFFFCVAQTGLAGSPVQLALRGRTQSRPLALYLTMVRPLSMHESGSIGRMPSSTQARGSLRSASQLCQ